VVAAEAALPQQAQALQGTPVFIGTAGNDFLHAGASANVLFGGAGADTFVVDQSPPAGGQVTHIADYTRADNDVIDVSALVGAAAQAGAQELDLRVAEDASGTFATLQMSAAGGQSAHWVDIAQLDGVHAGRQYRCDRRSCSTRGPNWRRPMSRCSTRLRRPRPLCGRRPGGRRHADHAGQRW